MTDAVDDAFRALRMEYVASLPDPLPLSVVLADHRAGDDSLFIYPWC